MPETLSEEAMAQAVARLAAMFEKVEVYAERCNQCLFSKDKVVSDEARRQVLAGCERENTHFICHKASVRGQNICCRGFYDALTSPYLDIMRAIHRVVFVPLPKPDKDLPLGG